MVFPIKLVIWKSVWYSPPRIIIPSPRKKFVYSKKLYGFFSDSNIFILLPLCDEYLMSNVKERCIKYLERKLTKWWPQSLNIHSEVIESLKFCIEVALEFKLKTILKHCLMEMAYYCSPGDLEKYYSEMNPEFTQIMFTTRDVKCGICDFIVKCSCKENKIDELLNELFVKLQ